MREQTNFIKGGYWSHAEIERERSVTDKKEPASSRDKKKVQLSMTAK